MACCRTILPRRVTHMTTPPKILTAILCLAVSSPAVAADVASGQKSSGFTGKLGLQLYSLHHQLAKDVPGTLDKVHDMGFKYVETAGMYGLSPAKFKTELDAHGLKVVSAHFGFEKFRDDVEGMPETPRPLVQDMLAARGSPIRATSAKRIATKRRRCSIRLARRSPSMALHSSTTRMATNFNRTARRTCSTC